MKLATYRGREYLYLRRDRRGRELVDPSTGEPTWVNEDEITSIRQDYPDFTVNRKDLHTRGPLWLRKHREARAEFTLAPKRKPGGKGRQTKKSTSTTRRRRAKVKLTPAIEATLQKLPPEQREAALKAMQG